MSKQNFLLFSLLAFISILIWIWIWMNNPTSNQMANGLAQPKTPTAHQLPPVTDTIKPEAEAPPLEISANEVESEAEDTAPESPGRKIKKRLTLPYVMSDGVAVVQGDWVLGKPTSQDYRETGNVVVPPLKRWATRIIPYYIQPSVTNPDRVKIALAMFESTAVRFVPHSNQEDGLVFEDGTDICKSYAGRIGGLQPIWIPNSCSPREIAHEIMHALGFVHEQNRSDRDEYINVMFDNIDEKYRDNFEKLPKDFMLLTGLGPFDFESLMIYPVWMFATRGQPTMESKITDRQIQPRDRLSASDIERINQAFGQL